MQKMSWILFATWMLRGKRAQLSSCAPHILHSSYSKTTWTVLGEDLLYSKYNRLSLYLYLALFTCEWITDDNVNIRCTWDLDFHVNVVSNEVSLLFVRELTLLWSILQRRIDVSLESFIERCLQFGAIARTIYHLLFLIRVIQTEVNKHVSSLVTSWVS